MRTKRITAAVVALLITTVSSKATNDIPTNIEWPKDKMDRQLGYADGKARAEYKFAKGTYEYLAPRRERWTDEDHYLNEKYKISPSFATPTNEAAYVLGWIEGYNDRIMVLFTEKFGTNVFQEAKQAVRMKKESKAQP